MEEHSESTRAREVRKRGYRRILYSDSRQARVLGLSLGIIPLVILLTVVQAFHVQARTFVPIATAIGSSLLLLGSAGQAVAEFRHSAWRDLIPNGFRNEIRYNLNLQQRSKRSMQLWKMRWPKGRLASRRAKVIEDAVAAADDEFIAQIQRQLEATIKARNWLILVGGAAIVLIASVKDGTG